MATNLTKAFVDLIAPTFQNLSVALIRQDGTECSGGGYQRQIFGAVKTDEDDDYIYISNNTNITFALASEDIAPIDNPVSKVQLYNNTNLVATIDLTVPKAYVIQDMIIIPIDGLKIKIPKVNT
jgi:hypothetical protein